MTAAVMQLLQEPEQIRLALSPLRRRILDLLREPSSATRLAAVLQVSRQLVNYHLRALERAGLVELVEERPRRGCVERVLRARAQAFVVDPAVMGAGDPVAAQDRYAAEHLVSAAAGVVRDVARMRDNAEREGSRLLTFTIETDVAFAAPRDVERFSTTLAELVAEAAARFHAPDGGRRYRVIVGGHPLPGEREETG
jgi:DNA-binding transcriptional ArsR family regulator